MKKILFLISCISTALFSLPVLNPAETVLLDKHLVGADFGEIWAIKAGYRGDFVFDRKLKDKLSDPIDHFSLFSNEGVLTLNIWERIDLYGFLGTSTFTYQNFQDGVELFLQTNPQFIYGAGVRATLWAYSFGRMGTTYIGLDAQYQKIARQSFDYGTADALVTSVSGLNYRLREVQISAAIAHKVGYFSPYIGFKWSQAKARSSVSNAFGPSFIRNLKSQNNFGMAVGLTLLDSGRMSITGEYRFIDENACTIFGEIKF